MARFKCCGLSRGFVVDRTGRAPPASCTPPRLSVPVYSLVTEAPLDGRRLHCAGACFNMNIMSYVTPVAHAPEHWYAVSLYHGTESRENFLTNHGGLLQILAPSHAPLVPLLGKTSAKDGVDKLVEARKLGFGTTTVKGWPVLEVQQAPWLVRKFSRDSVPW